MSAAEETIQDAEFTAPQPICHLCGEPLANGQCENPVHFPQKQSQALQTRTPADFVAMAIERNFPIETLRELMAMEKEWRAQQAEAAYTAALVKFGQYKQVVAHNRTGRTAGNTPFSYSDYPALVNAVTPWLAECELRFWHTQDDPIMEGKNIAYVMVYCHISHAAGHTSDPPTKFPAIPDGRLDGKVSPNQLLQQAITYAKRQSLSLALGLATAEDHSDDDSQKHKKEKAEPQSVSDQLRQPRATGPRKINQDEADQLGAAATESGIPKDAAKQIVQQAGFEKTSLITADKFPAILEAVKKWTAEAQSGELKVTAVQSPADPDEIEQRRIRAQELLDAVIDAGYKGNTKVLLKSVTGERELAKVPAAKLPGLITKLETELVGMRAMAN